MNEFELIARLTPGLPGNESVVEGAGDDCALLDLGAPGRWVLFKTDAVVEGVHFLPGTAGKLVGRKALARCLSDIAANAGNPVAALVTLGLPANYDPEYVVAIYDGLGALAREFKVAVVGGETTRNPGGLFLSISVVGTVEKNRCPLRSGAKPGDAIFVTGDLGGSIDGKHLEFVPRLEEARWLAANFPVRSMIDLSDGLAGDLRHILNASGVGAELLAKAVPVSRAARLRTRANLTEKTPLLAALTDGEDFELLLTVPSASAVPLLDAWKAQFPGTRLSCVGKITSEPGLRLREAHEVKPHHAHGHVHFE
jgi:thiamine-monophosphate kinase